VLRLSEVALKVDYSGDHIVVSTDKAQYSTHNLLISVPLGLLKEGAVEFAPGLPVDIQAAIDSIGWGDFEKLFVSFE
jgi:polyamine oxidase